MPMSGGGASRFRDQTDDYIIYLDSDSLWKAASRNATYPDYSAASFASVLNSALAARSAVGGKYKLSYAEMADIDLKTKIVIPATKDISWILEGNGRQVTQIKAHADLGANSMIEVVRNGIITHVANAGGGQILITTSTPHYLSANGHVLIAGTTDYNGSIAVDSVVSSTTFKVTHAYISDQSGTFQEDSWGSPQNSGVISIRDLGIYPNGIAINAIRLPYCSCDLLNLYSNANMAGSNHTLIGRIGGSGGPTGVNSIRNVNVGYTTTQKVSTTCFDTWVDNIVYDNINFGMNMSAGRIFYLQGVMATLNHVAIYLSGASDPTLFSLIGMDAKIGSLQTVATGSGMTLFKNTSGGQIVVGEVRYEGGIGSIIPYYDDVTRKGMNRLDLGGRRDVSGGTISPMSLTATEYLPWEGMSTIQTDINLRTEIIGKPMIITKFKAWLTVAPGAGKNRILTIMKNGAATAVTVTIADTNQQATDSTNVAVFNEGDLIAIRDVPTGSPATAGASCVSSINYI